MKRLTPAFALATLALAACSQKVEPPADSPAPVPAATTPSDAIVAGEPSDTRPGKVRRDAMAGQAQAQIEAQMAAQMQKDAAADKSDH